MVRVGLGLGCAIAIYKMAGNFLFTNKKLFFLHFSTQDICLQLWLSEIVQNPTFVKFRTLEKQ